jgi:hypothetical protein
MTDEAMPVAKEDSSRLLLLLYGFSEHAIKTYQNILGIRVVTGCHI